MNHASEQTAKLTRLQQSIRARKGLIGCGMGFSVALHHSGRVLYTGENRWGQGDVETVRTATSVVCGQDYVVARLEDGTLHKMGRGGAGDAFFNGLSCVRRVACGSRHTAVLLGNGRVLVDGENRHGQCRTADWSPVTDICCGERFTAGLTEDGHVLISGGTRVQRHTVRSWTQIVGLFADYEGKHIYAITAFGTLLSTAPLSYRVERWRNLVFVAASRRAIWGITVGGQLLSTHPDGRTISQKDSYVACAAGDHHALVLARDGHIRATGYDSFGQIETWGFGAIFRNFEELSVERRSAEHRLEQVERAYQIHYTAANRYQRHMVAGDRMTACMTADGRVLTTVGYGARRQWGHVRALACGNAHILALHTDGHVSADGNDVEGCCSVSEWSGIKAIAAGKYHSLGLTEKGMVLFCGQNDQGQGDVRDWNSIRMIRTSDRYTVGVTFDGHILICGKPPFEPHLITEEWDHPTDIVITETHMVALYADGHVQTTLPRETALAQNTSETSFVCDTADWKNVRAIAAGAGFTVGLCYGGTVLAIGKNDAGQCDVSSWRHITYIACGHAYTAALTADGTLCCAGVLQHAPRFDRTDTAPISESSQAKGMIAISAGTEHLVALSRNGRVLAWGTDTDGRCSSAAHFVLFRDARQLYGYGNYRKMAEGETSHATDTVTEAKPVEVG